MITFIIYLLCYYNLFVTTTITSIWVRGINVCNMSHISFTATACVITVLSFYVQSTRQCLLHILYPVFHRLHISQSSFSFATKFITVICAKYIVTAAGHLNQVVPRGTVTLTNLPYVFVVARIFTKYFMVFKCLASIS